jgi:hypothetical protein
MDLVRMILMRVEGSSSARAPQDLGIKAFVPEEIGYHVHIMMQGGLIEGCHVSTMHSPGAEAVPRSLTWKGHEFLDLARDQERWNRAKAIMAKVGSAPFSVWTRVLTDLLWKSLEEEATHATGCL